MTARVDGSVGRRSAIRRALSMGVHRAVIVTDDALRGADALATARVLAAAVGRTSYDVVLAGVESTDGYTGTVPITVAELLGLPAATFARKLDVSNGSIRVERQTEAGYDVVESSLPALVTVTAGATEPRYPTLKGIMGAKQKPLEQLDARRPRPHGGRRSSRRSGSWPWSPLRRRRRERSSRPTGPPLGSPTCSPTRR